MVEFAEAAGIFDDAEIIESIDGRDPYGEERIQALGQSEGNFFFVVYTWRAGIRHIITAWKVGEHGRRSYQDLFARRNRGDEETR